MKRHFHARIRDGVGREVQFASLGDSFGVVRDSVNSVDNFIFKRSGVKLSGPTKNRLAAMEASTLSGARRRLTMSELSDVLSETALERLSRLSDQEITHVDDALRGFNAPDLPESFRRRTAIKAQVGMSTIISSERFVAEMKAMRRRSIEGAFRDVAHRAVEDNVKRVARVLSGAVPEQFGGAWNVANDTEGSMGVTPLQAVLITYSAASQDILCDSEENLNKRMQGIQAGLTRVSGQNYPSPDGHTAYGVNGYLVSSPLDIVFDERTVNSILDRIEERSAS
ncbi:MAG: hypothetical protein AUG51_22470 [Acidobacteria bacterium 13_1_20CM_3_53_8]|nr:MAG: hypothetical protein AUG51_22470 [Acidobacteria bacterium 13_1_20CM_3_53_8]